MTRPAETLTQPKRKYLHPEKYRECGLTVGLCSCVQENKGVPERDCEYCYGTGIFVYTNIDIPVPSNCPHWVKDDIYVKGFRCSLYRDTCHSAAQMAFEECIRKISRDSVDREAKLHEQITLEKKRIADVVKELEQKIVTYQKEAREKDNYCLSYRSAGIAEAIALLKEGLGNEKESR